MIVNTPAVCITYSEFKVQTVGGRELCIIQCSLKILRKICRNKACEQRLGKTEQSKGNDRFRRKVIKGQKAARKSIME